MQLHDYLEQVLVYFNAGGPTMVPIMAFSFAIWLIILLKSYWFITENRCEAAPADCLRTTPQEKCRCACWQREIADAYIQSKSDAPDLNRKLLHSLCVRQHAKTNRLIATLFILAAITPLLGLLGTVSGMISTFNVISQFGTGNARALASGISEALVTTQSGLVAAIPGLLMAAILARRADKMKKRMEMFCIGLQYETDSPMTSTHTAG
ncbi:MotA/TolQ/ExbB proton channel [Oleidesulfovibrio alaskensis G20]|uniref:MotA/TolQ/ExbB proton channel n=1 Tax=Oleidesulfovibrio alaskensis (strain ATCC BAA-1058 / DSM 17464 / G20) TaxID=207559 RepID=Q30ZE5_OLEA2|nr:MotA/TolQ/ExbB proton channel family protein [Oleidesulfovibrio alaskensis]ABB38951.1 MotA/TolQ/ExbB proton channel [Oleidesulfovibrio alaskensis G20]MBG0772264.1 MotA/TolQ/ExbB proton channel family protein [Oleidesulfovibrio alaskensis]MBL3581084.1 MotA/TolQ/ExbB proton channel family protein [Oleidesulfovibrio alaskensis]